MSVILVFNGKQTQQRTLISPLSLSPADVCGHFDADIVSIDLGARAFKIKNGPVNLALSRGMVFEIRYSPAIRDQAARKNLFVSAAALIKITKGKNILLSSDAQAVLELRAPADVINMFVFALPFMPFSLPDTTPC